MIIHGAFQRATSRVVKLGLTYISRTQLCVQNMYNIHKGGTDTLIIQKFSSEYIGLLSVDKPPKKLHIDSLLYISLHGLKEVWVGNWNVCMLSMCLQLGIASTKRAGVILSWSHEVVSLNIKSAFLLYALHDDCYSME